MSISKRLAERLAPWALPLVLLAVWQAAVEFGWLSSRILPAPSAVLEAGWTLLRSGEIWQHLAISGWRAAIGFLIGGAIGLVLGFVTGLSKWGERFLDSSVQMIRNVPHLALIPLVILWFGIDESAKIFLVALGTLFPIYLNTYHGIRGIDPGLLEMARSYGLSGFALFRQVILPGALPSILVGVRFALGFMWLTLIVAETMGHRLTAFDIHADGSLANRRIYAQLPEDVSPDGIALDAEGAVWLANPEGQFAALRVCEDGEIVERVEGNTQCYAVMLGGQERRSLFICGSDSHDPAEIAHAPSATLRVVEVAVPGAGLP